MSDGDDDTTELSPESFDERLNEAEAALEAAETEADLDDVEATLDEIDADIESAELPEPDDEDEESIEEELSSRLSDLRDDLESQRGPYAEEAIETLEDAKSTITDTRWTEQGDGEIVAAVESFTDDFNGVLDSSVSVDGEAEDDLTAAIDDAVSTIESAGLDADDDAETIADLIDVADSLADDLDDAEEWDDLETREKLQVQGFYDVLGHYKDYPPELSALKEHEKRGNVEMIALAFDSFQSDFMQEYCIEAFTRMNDDRAYETIEGQAKRRDKGVIKAIGKMAAEEGVEMLVDYVDSDNDPALQKVVFKALGEIGSEEATQPIANKLVTENENVRSAAARALGLLGDTRAVEPLADVLEDDDVDSVRASAAWALRQVGTESALEAAAGYVDDRSYLVQREAELAADFLGEGKSEPEATV
ncbi:HEAT repeat domain-containing protein [Haloferax mediterranei ATCC 33500]|uniref:HEAT repeat domain-containing protein n=1 Tax=Haloferax mediterranei (strain ATCC 33500 / DSM 1411 / JCM 8866 / NBRC 14739 / NCIMB 2177 / R-4) TaxID=523841 RepID=I3R3C6_HALMT|nr:HEAT repeat domain-containing protein [Haloferax mediterranei]AFK18736.1 PBS lyase HEAT-like repeat protein [Haloferax mediterranei ATCC 33500]AHZ21897.1 phycocyanobilin lyase [Haloferax mediterranei ATCC 33500]EMA03405.1 PBS lyase HEAT-like repeat protein [Haloferax mediterranei ATCC 33500]MDX5988831.1 HEAT repeat domain-containing protein [Haloferax mediterranei ATCC 33500]QCQ75233.1 HEAT repeat domain-containing protein [Haloferax mediterranei ATCC 33500]